MARDTSEKQKARLKRAERLTFRLTDFSALEGVRRATEELSKRIRELVSTSEKIQEHGLRVDHNFSIHVPAFTNEVLETMNRIIDEERASLRRELDRALHGPFWHPDDRWSSSQDHWALASQLAARQVVELIPYLRASIASEKASLKEEKPAKAASKIAKEPPPFGEDDGDNILYAAMVALVDNMDQNVTQMREDIKALSQVVGK